MRRGKTRNIILFAWWFLITIFYLFTCQLNSQIANYNTEKWQEDKKQANKIKMAVTQNEKIKQYRREIIIKLSGVKIMNNKND
jgi:hypothetical protein